ncbi:hypothetical protein FH608_044535 [Nonomuraea phyllanthi]|uniref:TetR/AcrR family transcriptional regulator n=1 Tax=Nonomuraea phyllanthi TaxID=2219224 RepID=A0A5C4VFJ1_9ACTN|nr:hypothetical protein [Nonomuraea phyllanthi]KAB8188497.1 hypothetical protein FH608_044535 [Nonomuraea phyllanthi]
MADQIATALAPVATDPDLPGLEKLRRFFGALGRWKGRRRDLLLALLRVWQSDDNAVVRQKLRPGIADRVAPLLAAVLRRARDDGETAVPYPEQTARVVVSLIQDLNDRLGDMVLSFDETGRPDLPAAQETVAAYTCALERILGLPAESIVLVDPAVLRSWFTPNGDET